METQYTQRNYKISTGNQEEHHTTTTETHLEASQTELRAFQTNQPMESIPEERSNHSTASSTDGLSVDPESTAGKTDDEDSLFSDLISETSASSSVFETPNLVGNTNLLEPLTSDGEDENENEEDDHHVVEGGEVDEEEEVGDEIHMVREDSSNEDEETLDDTISADISSETAESEENRIIENQLDENSSHDSEEEDEIEGKEQTSTKKVYDLGGTYDLGAPAAVTPSPNKVKVYDLGEKKYDLGSYLSDPKQNETKDVTSQPSVQNSQSTQHRSGSSAYILHKWMTERDWNSARTYLSSPDLNRRHLQASIFYKNEDGETSLHIACRKRAPYDVVKAITDVGGIDCVMAVDTYGGSLSLHHACHFHAPVDVIRLLVYIGGAESVQLRDAIGNLPLHWALSKGATFSTIKLLIDIGGHETINVTNKLGWNALHAATYFSSNFNTVKLLVDISGPSVVNCINKRGQTPLDILYEKNPFDKDSIQLVQNVMGQDKGILTWLSTDTVEKTMTWIGRQPESVQQKAFHYPFIQMIINEALLMPRYLCIFMVDIFAQLLLVITMSFFISIKTWFGYKDISLRLFIVLVASISWLGIRCIAQMIASPIHAWVSEISNWTNGFQTALVIWSILILSQDGINREYESIVAVLATGMVWFRSVFVVGELFHSIAVFSAALQRIVSKLFAFTVTSALVLIGFAHMLYTASEWDREWCMQKEGIDQTSCVSRTLGESYTTVFTEFFTPSTLIDQDLDFNGSRYRTILIIIFAVLVELLLLNVLIAEIVHSLSDAKKGGQKAFWQNRYLVVSHLSKVYKTICFFNEKKPLEINATGTDVGEDGEPKNKIPKSRFAFATANYEVFPGDFYNFRRWWLKDDPPPHLPIRLKYFIAWGSVEEILMPGTTFERVISGGKRESTSFVSRAFLYVLFPFSLLIQCICFCLGLISFGYLWPQWMKRALFSGPVDYGDSQIPAIGKHLDILQHEMKSIHNAVKAEKFAIRRMEDAMKAIQSDVKFVIKRSSSSSVYSDEDGMSAFASDPGA